MFVRINVDLTHTYLGSNVVSIPEQLISTASLVKDKSGESPFYVVHSTYYINKLVHGRQIMMLTISVKKFLTLDGEIKIA
jgi:hypothetical protein